MDATPTVASHSRSGQGRRLSNGQGRHIPSTTQCYPILSHKSVFHARITLSICMRIQRQTGHVQIAGSSTVINRDIRGTHPRNRRLPEHRNTRSDSPAQHINTTRHHIKHGSLSKQHFVSDSLMAVCVLTSYTCIII